MVILVKILVNPAILFSKGHGDISDVVFWLSSSHCISTTFTNNYFFLSQGDHHSGVVWKTLVSFSHLGILWCVPPSICIVIYICKCSFKCSVSHNPRKSLPWFHPKKYPESNQPEIFRPSASLCFSTDLSVVLTGQESHLNQLKYVIFTFLCIFYHVSIVRI